MTVSVPVAEGGCWEMESWREVGPPFQEPSAPKRSIGTLWLEAGALSSLGIGALPELRKEELGLEEPLSKSQFPFSECCPQSDFT